MLIVNTTYQVSEQFENEWKNWVLSEYIPEVTSSGMLVNPGFFRLLIENEANTVSYALQFQTQSFETLEKWFEKFGTELQHGLSKRFDDKVLGFTTLMESV